MLSLPDSEGILPVMLLIDTLIMSVLVAEKPTMEERLGKEFPKGNLFCHGRVIVADK